MIESPLRRLSAEQIAERGRLFARRHDEFYESRGAGDRRYIVAMIELHRRLAVLGRALLMGSRFKVARLGGTTALSLAKILENMEIGHNVLHGQWDWMNDPQIHSSTWDWDTASTAEAWKHSHNYIHHTYTNIRGKDKDLGYEIMRIDPHQPWNPVYLLQPVYNVLLMLLFEWGVAFHDLDFDAIRSGEKSKEKVIKELKGIAGKARLQIQKDYVAWPLLSGLAMAALDLALNARRIRDGRKRGRLGKVRGRLGRLRIRRDERRRILDEAVALGATGGARAYRSALWANVAANIIRNLWAHSIIFCGHFPDQTYTFSQEEAEDESRGAWYVRQLVGAANIEGGPMFHVASGNLGYQVGHHLYPDMPSSRYAEIAPRVKEICGRYELPYHSGPLHKQLGRGPRTILGLAFPGGKPRPRPGPYQGGEGGEHWSKAHPRPAPAGPEGSGPEQSSDGVRV